MLHHYLALTLISATAVAASFEMPAISVDLNAFKCPDGTVAKRTDWTNKDRKMVHIDCKNNFGEVILGGEWGEDPFAQGSNEKPFRIHTYREQAGASKVLAPLYQQYKAAQDPVVAKQMPELESNLTLAADIYSYDDFKGRILSLNVFRKGSDSMISLFHSVFDTDGTELVKATYAYAQEANAFVTTETSIFPNSMNLTVITKGDNTSPWGDRNKFEVTCSDPRNLATVKLVEDQAAGEMTIAAGRHVGTWKQERPLPPRYLGLPSETFFEYQLQTQTYAAKVGAAKEVIFLTACLAVANAEPRKDGELTRRRMKLAEELSPEFARLLEKLN
jgi:hypothetical protein